MARPKKPSFPSQPECLDCGLLYGVSTSCIFPHLRRLAAILLLQVLFPQLCQAQVVISEVFWMGSDMSTADEWIELENIGNELIDIANWKLTYLNTKNEQQSIVEFPVGASIGSGARLVVANYSALQSRLEREPDHISTAMSPPNTKLQLRLWNASGALIDEVDDGTGLPFAGSNGTQSWQRASMERVSGFIAGTVKENWRTATTFLGFDNGARLFGTPGYANGSGPSVDVFPPHEAMSLKGTLSHTGALSLLWQPSDSLDVAQQILSMNPLPIGLSGSILLPSETDSFQTDLSTATGCTVLLQTRDDQGNTSTGVLLELRRENPPVASSGSALLRITEVLADPIGSDAAEWIEVANMGSATGSLAGMKLSVGGKSFGISAGTGSQVKPGAYRLFSASESRLSLRNAGDSVALLSTSGEVMDMLEYPSVPEGVSVGRSMAGDSQSFCVPTPAAPNLPRPWDVNIVVQSGQLSGAGHVSINFQVQAQTGSLAGVSCSVDFGDGTASTSCNPPSHRFDTAGEYTVQLQAKNYCGTTVTHARKVHVSPRSATVSPAAKPVPMCTASASSGVVINEFLPAPGTASDEWIELRNVTALSVDLCGWMVDDEEGGSAPYDLSGYRMEPYDYLLLPRSTTKVALNNEGDHVRLLSPALSVGELEDAENKNKNLNQDMYFTKAIKDKSYANKESDIWLWTPLPTPGLPNAFPAQDPPFTSQEVELIALPNPKGVDESHEQFAIGNLGDRALQLAGWYVQIGKENHVFDYTLISPGEYRWFSAKALGLELANAEGSLLLFAEDHSLVSALRWSKAEQKRTYRSVDPQAWNAKAFVRAVLPGLRLVVQLFSEHRGRVIWKDIRHVQLDGISEISGYEKLALLKLKDLLEGKNLELKNYSNTGSLLEKNGLTVRVEHGEIPQVTLLRAGLVLQDEAQADPAKGFALYEDYARENKVGVWSDDRQTREIMAKRHEDVVRQTVLDGRFVVRPTVDPGLTESSTKISFIATLPSRIHVAVGTGAFMVMSGSLVLGSDTDIRAYAETLPTASGRVFHTPVFSGSYVLRRPDYSGMLAISEVYPSPDTRTKVLGEADSEWIELRNLTSHPVNVAGWSVRDSATKEEKSKGLSSSITVPARGLVTLGARQLGIAMNNNDEEIYLIDPNGKNIDHIKYSKIIKRQSFIAGNTAEISPCISDVPTPGKENICVHLASATVASDADADGIADDRERYLAETDPMTPDTDGDGWPDGFEYETGMNARQPDIWNRKTALTYREYLLESLKPKWHLYVSKGLTLKMSKTSGVLAAWFRSPVTGEWMEFSRTKAGNFDSVVYGELTAGSYPVPIRIADVLGAGFELPHEVVVTLSEDYARKKPVKRGVSKQPKKTRVTQLKAKRTSSILERLGSPRAQWDSRRRSSIPLLPFAGGLTLLLALALLVLHGLRRGK